MNRFLPDGYEKIPSTGRYMVLQDGRNLIRVVGSAIIGWVYWNTAGKPVRLKERPSSRPLDIRIESDGKEKIKHFWAFPVWNYADKTVQILELTQSTIQSGIKALVDDETRPASTSVTRSGAGLDTEYAVLGIPPKAVDPKIIAEFEQTPVNLSALFGGGDPFAPGVSAAEAIDQTYDEPAITQEAAPVPDRMKTGPAEVRPKTDKDSGPKQGA